MKQRFLLTLSLVCVILLSTLLLQTVASHTAATELVTQKLTDSDATVYDIADNDDPIVATGSKGVHILWSEYINYPNPPDYNPDIDLFYAQLPMNVVRQLKATSGPVSAMRMAVDSANHAHIVWGEDTKTSEGYDLFYWTDGMSTPQNISDSALSEGNIGNVLIVVDANDLPYVLWAEATNTSSFNPAVFYWTEGSSTTKLSVGGLTMGTFTVTDVDGLAVKNGVVHALWQDIDTSTSGGPEPFYWNSTTQTVVNLRNGLSGSEGFVSDYFLGENGIFYVLWYDDVSGTYDYRLWDSASGQNQLIVNSASGYTTQLLSDGVGNAHVLWKGGNTTYHWDSVNKTSSAVGDGGAPPLTYMNGSDGKTGDYIHVVWAAEDANWPTHQTDLFYWRSDMAQPINVTDHTQPSASAANIRFLVDETDVAHVLWSEGSATYYNSADDLTTVLTGAISAASGKRMAMPPLEGPYELGDVMTARAGEAYVMLENDTTTPFRVWLSATGTYSDVTAVYPPASPSIGMIWLDSNGQIHTAWEDNSPAGEGSNLHYWNGDTGSQDLTDNANTDGDIDSDNGNVFGAADKSGRVYLAWTEYFDGETDMYAAYEPVQYKYVYLPVVIK